MTAVLPSRERVERGVDAAAELRRVRLRVRRQRVQGRVDAIAERRLIAVGRRVPGPAWISDGLGVAMA